MAIITGTNASDPELEGGDGADQIFGLAGDDILIGLGGDDLLEGGAGADELFGSAGFDTASYRSSDKAVRIDLDSFTFSGGHADGDSLYSIEGVVGSAFGDTMIASDAQGCAFRGEGGKDTLAGRGQADALYGGGDDDRLDGFGGNDTLEGGSGNDILVGWAGDDVLRGGAGTDTVAFGYVSSGVVADLASGTATGDANFGNDRLSGIENIVGTGLADQLAGDGGANTLTGGAGGDVLVGRGGADRFVYESRYDSNPKAPDVIRDFSRAQGDRIDLRAVDANEQVGGDQAFQFIGGSQFTATGQLRFFQRNGDTYVEANTTDAFPGADWVFVLDPLVAARAGDFLL